MKQFKHKPTSWWGFETLEAECNCDLDNPEKRIKQFFKTEKKRDEMLAKWLEESISCIKEYTTFCTTLNENYDS